MKTKWAEDNLQTIRTLMERSAVYRRALGPVMVLAGVIGIIGGIVGWQMRIDSSRGFVLFWMGIAIIALAGAFLLVRRQALKDSEPFWSPPTRRVAQALTPAFAAGLVVSVPFVLYDWTDTAWVWWLPVMWASLYGLALHSAGFFVDRGIKAFGWLFLLLGFVMFLAGTCLLRFVNPLWQAHIIMGGIFGGLHLAYGIYLYFTERKNPVA
jgi:hypothetical protein